MEKYSVLELLGEGSYGKVLKCRHNDTGTVVAIKKFIETEEDTAARKVALREIRMLKKLHHPNLVCLLEVFRRKKRFHLVFEYMHCSLLEELESSGPLPEDQARNYLYQIIRGVHYCHSHYIIHRDIKPENILISDLGVVKICDFGFARLATTGSEPFTDYVATRWYRPPELLVGDSNYGRGVDVWALGCILVEMLTSEPLFAGDSDIDQLHQITKLLGRLTDHQKTLMMKQVEKLRLEDSFTAGILEQIKDRLEMDVHYSLKDRFPDIDNRTLDIIVSCLRIDPRERLDTEQLLKHSYFTWDKFLLWFLPQLQKRIQQEAAMRVPLSDLPCTPTSTVFGLVPETKPRRFKSGWSIHFMDDAVNQHSMSSHYQKEMTELRKSEGDTETKGTFSCYQLSAAPPTHQSSQIQRNRLDPKELKELENVAREMPKINAEYRRHMMPETQYIRPVKGRLVYDKYLKLPCTTATVHKPVCEGIYLPIIKGSDKKAGPEKRNSQLKRKTSSPRENINLKSDISLT